MTRQRSLLMDIEQAVLDPAVALPDLLRKCVILGGQIGSPELRDWAAQELKGYGLTTEVPTYRTFVAPLKIDVQVGTIIHRGRDISLGMLPEVAAKYFGPELTFRNGVGELTAIVTQYSDAGEFRSAPQNAVMIAQLFDQEIGDEYQQTIAIYWAVSTTRIQGILDIIRSSLAELVAELQAGMTGDEPLPSADLATQAVNVAVYGKGNRVTVGSAQAQGANNTATSSMEEIDNPEFWTRSRRIGAAVVGVATVVAAGAAVLDLI